MVAVAGGVSDSTEACLDALERARAYVGELIARMGGVGARSEPKEETSSGASEADQERLLRVFDGRGGYEGVELDGDSGLGDAACDSLSEPLLAVGRGRVTPRCRVWRGRDMVPT